MKLLSRLSAIGAVLLSLVMLVLGSIPAAAKPEVRFTLNDQPGSWFRSNAGAIAGTRSLAVTNPGTRIKFNGDSDTVHTIASLVFPTGAAGMPFDSGITSGSGSVELTTPGLYVFFCEIHPFMFAAVIVDDTGTDGLDLGESITLVNGASVPTSSDLATRLLRTFFIATNPANWQDHTSSQPWHITYPDVDVRITGGAVVNLPVVLNARYGNDLPLAADAKPGVPGVGQVWVDTEFELTAGKSNPGTATAIDATTWEVSRKVALPGIDMNNPHNMWTDRDQKLIYQTEWFSSKLTVFDRETGNLIRQLSVGKAPAHVMTSPLTDNLFVTLNGDDSNNSVVELSPGAVSGEGTLDIGAGHPHAHWISPDGKTLVTPNVIASTSSVVNLENGAVTAISPTGLHPLATGMMPDGSKYYLANLADSTVTVIDTATGDVLKTIDLLANYSPVSGNIKGPVGGLPIQTPVSPDGRFVVTANTLTATITIIDTRTDTLVAMLPGDPGAHGVQFGAKAGGGYYAYIASKFSNSLLVVDADPDGDGNAADAVIAGRISLVASPQTAIDDQVTGNAGMGGQGVLAVPIVYNGWVQHLPQTWLDKLTPAQRDPVR